jgi:type IX secretion system PorP/SprF family membrane protein
MRQFFLNICLFLFSISVFGQLYPESDQYVDNALAINPAFSGSQDALSTTILYRNYLTGIDGSPKTMSLSVHAPLNNERIGLGFLVLNDEIGVTRETSIAGNYAYRMNLGYGKLAFGLGIGLTISKIEWNKLAAQDAGDEELAENYTSGIIPNFSTGIYYSTKKYFIGLSMPKLLSYKYDTKKDKYQIRNNFSEYNYFCNAGIVLNINQNLKIFPSLLVKYHKANGTQIDINSQIIIKDKIWLGISYRTKNTLVGMIQCQVNNQLRIAYSYDINVGKYGKHINGAHEIMLNYIFNYDVEVEGPRQF